MLSLLSNQVRGGPLEITGGGGGKNFSVDDFFLSPICLHDFFFRRGSFARIFFVRTSFYIKGIQSSAQFNYSTAQGDTLFRLVKLEYRDYRERNELLNGIAPHDSRRLFFTCKGNSASSCWSIPFFNYS